MQSHAILRNMVNRTTSTAPVAGRPRATDRGLALLRVVADSPEGVVLADAARAVDLTPSTALRQLRSLESSGFAARLADGRFVPGPELLRIARSLSASVSMPQLAERTLTRLAHATGESTYLAEVVDQSSVVYTASEPGRHAVRHVGWLGQRVPRRGTAVGAAIARRVDPDGVSVRCDAVEEGITAVSAPVIGPGGHVIAALSVVGPTYRLRDRRLAAARVAVATEAAALSRAAGGPAV